MTDVEFAPFSDRGIIVASWAYTPDSAVEFIGGIWWTATYNFRQERPSYSCVKEDWADIELRCSLPLGLTTQVSAKVRFMGLEGRHDEIQVTVDKDGCTFNSGSYCRKRSTSKSYIYLPLVVAIEVVGKEDESEEQEEELEADVVLDVGGREFPASIEQLSKLSDTLAGAFNQEFAQDQPKKVALSGISADNFDAFLKALTTNNARAITVDNVVSIRGLADRFHSPSLLKRCAEFIFRCKNMSWTEKLLMADKWNNRNLVKLLSGAVATNDSLLPLIQDGTMKKLTQATQDLLLEKLFSL